MEIGSKVIWLHQPTGGYGYIIPVPATILRFKERNGKNMAKIEVFTVKGQRKTRWVKADNLKEERDA